MTPVSSRLLVAAALSLVATAACGGDESGQGGGSDGGNASTSSGMGGMGAGMTGCGTMEAPTLLDVADLSPPVGSMGPNQGIVHVFSLPTAPGQLPDVTFLFGPAHTAGDPPDTFSFSVSQLAGVFTYTSTSVVWPQAGHVEFGVQSPVAFGNGCFYKFPEPLFSYDVTP
ncbi:MAG: hypothetical protein KC731_19015 [Myxococcales bacterium]|nr:hypothetical protein [Myxococcales bacterium]